jgi:hypothetical protein
MPDRWTASHFYFYSDFILYKHTQKPWQLRSWLITGFVTGLKRRVSLVEQELFTLPEHLSSVLYVCLVDHCLFFWPLCCIFFLDIRIMITPLVSSNSSSIYYKHSINPTIYNCDDYNFLPVLFFHLLISRSKSWHILSITALVEVTLLHSPSLLSHLKSCKYETIKFHIIIHITWGTCQQICLFGGTN